MERQQLAESWSLRKRVEARIFWTEWIEMTSKSDPFDDSLAGLESMGFEVEQ